MRNSEEFVKISGNKSTAADLIIDILFSITNFQPAGLALGLSIVWGL